MINIIKKEIQTLTENNEALQLRVDTLTRNNKVKDKQIKDLKEENLSLRQSLSFWKDKFLKVISFIKDKIFGKEKEREIYMDVAEDLYSKKIIEEDTFEDLQDTYEFSKNHDYDKEKDDFDLEKAEVLGECRLAVPTGSVQIPLCHSTNKPLNKGKR